MLINVLINIIFINCVFSAQSVVVINENISLENVNRTIILKSQIAKIVNIIEIKNNGSNFVDYVLYCIEEPKIPSYMFAQTMAELRLDLIETMVHNQNDKKCWKIQLNNSLAYEEAVTIQVNEYWIKVMIPYPKYISQNEAQYVLYKGNVYFFSPYKIKNITTTVNLFTKHVENYTEIQPTTNNDGNIIYGPFYNLTAFSLTSFDVHFLKNIPFLIVKNLERIIMVSHWGNIEVEERVELFHNGAKLKGYFSRFDYKENENRLNPSILQSYTMSLPASARNIYFYDDLGNISTCFPQVLEDEVLLKVQPRYPLFGGWKIRHVIGYKVPSYEYLYNSGNEYLLNMRIIDYIYDHMVVEKLTTKIVLPKGVHSIQLTTPYSVEKMIGDVNYTQVLANSFMNIKGHTVIILSKENLIKQHIQEFYLQYKFSSLLILQEPLLIIVALYFIFLILIVFNHIDFSIHKTITQHSNQVSKVCKKIKTHQDKRFNLYHLYDNELSKLKISKDITSFNSSMKSINNEYKTETNIIGHLCEKLTTNNMYEKLQNLQKLDKVLMELYVEHQSLCVDKFVSGNINRSVFKEGENLFFVRRNELLSQLNKIYKSIE